MSDTVRTPDDLAGLNYRLPEPIDTNVVRARLNAADDKVDALCDGTERWVMRVPPQPNRDPDLVIGAALMAAHQTVTALEAARDEAAELRAENDRLGNAAMMCDLELTELRAAIKEWAEATDAEGAAHHDHGEGRITTAEYFEAFERFDAARSALRRLAGDHQ